MINQGPHMLATIWSACGLVARAPKWIACAACVLVIVGCVVAFVVLNRRDAARQRKLDGFIDAIESKPVVVHPLDFGYRMLLLGGKTGGKLFPEGGRLGPGGILLVLTALTAFYKSGSSHVRFPDAVKWGDLVEDDHATRALGKLGISVYPDCQRRTMTMMPVDKILLAEAMVHLEDLMRGPPKDA